MEITRIDEFNNSKISLNRKILSWGWYKKPNTAHLFIHCLLRANFKDENWQGLLIKRGQFVTGRLQLAIETGLTEMQIRTALKHLSLTNEITIKSTKQYSIITVNKYNEYQNNYRTNNQQITNNYPSDNQAITTNNNDNNDNNTTTIYNENLKNFYGKYSNVYLTDKDYKDLEVKIMSKEKMKEIIDNLSENIGTGKEDLYNPLIPQAHKIRIEQYWRYMLKNPSKFRSKQEEKKEKEVIKVATMENYKPWG